MTTEKPGYADATATGPSRAGADVGPHGAAHSRGLRPSFTVVMAAHNAADTIADALESVFAQTLPPHDVVVVDDGSSDGTAAIVDQWRDRVRLVRTPNRGPAAARNTAVTHAKGDFLAILDADDLFLPERLEALSDLAVARPDLDLLMTNVLYEQGNTVFAFFDRRNRFPVSNQRREILTRNFVQFPAVRRTVFVEHGGFDESLLVAEDWDLWIRLVLDGAAVGCVDRPLLRYRRLPGSLTSNDERNLQARLDVLRRYRARSDLGYDEIAALEASCIKAGALLEVIEGRRALMSRAVDWRQRMLKIARNPRQRPAHRAQAVATVLFPALGRASESARSRRRRNVASAKSSGAM
jgi:glycosyltransferase involved in cell wall biosynthesis